MTALLEALDNKRSRYVPVCTTHAHIRANDRNADEHNGSFYSVGTYNGVIWEQKRWDEVGVIAYLCPFLLRLHRLRPQAIWGLEKCSELRK